MIIQWYKIITIRDDGDGGGDVHGDDGEGFQWLLSQLFELFEQKDRLLVGVVVQQFGQMRQWEVGTFRVKVRNQGVACILELGHILGEACNLVKILAQLKLFVSQW